MPLQKEWIRLEHTARGHIGFEKTWELLCRENEWGDPHLAQIHARTINRECQACQACDRPRNKHGPLVFTPIPPANTAHVAIDIFQLPSVRTDWKVYDCMVVCVDRHSGWIIAIPEKYVGLKGETVAKALLPHWSMMGIPTKITTDRG